jgi:PTS system N-acetylgalactosamine-specific IIB component
VIVLVRIDNRLLHGQILEAWVPRLKVNRIVVVDDDAAASPLAKAAMTLALPPDLPAEVVRQEVVDWPALAAASDRALVLFRNVAALKRAAGLGLAPSMGPHVNLGNVHYEPGRRPVTPSVFLSAEELSVVEELSRAGFDIEARAIPSDAPSGLRDLKERYAAGDGRG